MDPAAKQLGTRIRELRKRHFPHNGSATLAEALGISAGELERFERGVVPSGDLLVRLCELTGEDLQWLLTGHAARGTVVIAGARRRHQDLLTRLAQALDRYPRLSGQIERFFEVAETAAKLEESRPALPESTSGPRRLIPIFDEDQPPPLADPPETRRAWLELRAEQLVTLGDSAAELIEPTDSGGEPQMRAVNWVRARDREGRTREFLDSHGALDMLPDLLAVTVSDASMRPLVEPGDAVIVSPSVPPELGRPALLLIEGQSRVACRVWLGPDGDGVNLGRAADGATQRVARASIRWALDVMFCARRAA